MTKTCSYCKKNKSMDEFGRDKNTTTGLKSRCKSCDKEYFASYYAVHSEAIKNRTKEWKDKNRPASEPVIKKERTKEEIMATNREKSRRWRERNLEKARAMGRASSARRRAGGLISTTTKRRNEWELLISFYGNECMHPDCDNSDKLHMDHVTPLAMGGNHDISNLQILCQFHNIQKGARSCSDYRPEGWREQFVA